MFKNLFKLFLFSIYLAVFTQTLYLLLQSLKHLKYAFPVFLLQYLFLHNVNSRSTQSCFDFSYENISKDNSNKRKLKTSFFFIFFFGCFIII